LPWAIGAADSLDEAIIGLAMVGAGSRTAEVHFEMSAAKNGQ